MTKQPEDIAQELFEACDDCFRPGDEENAISLIAAAIQAERDEADRRVEEARCKDPYCTPKYS